MKRYLAIGAAVVVLLAAGWTLFWWHGRGEVDRALDAGVETLGQQGWTVTWDEREIGGFPFGYTVLLTRVTARDAAGGLALRLPWAVAETAGSDRIVIRMPEAFGLDMPLPAAVGGDGGEMPDTLATTGTSRDLVMAVSADGSVEVTADRLAWTVEQPDLGRTVRQTIESLEATTRPDPPGARYRLHAARVGAEAELVEPDGPPSTALASMHDVVVEGASTVGSPEALAEMLYGGAPGQAEGSLTTGPAEVRVVSEGGAPGMLDWRAEAISGKAALSSGRMELTGETRGNVWSLTSPDPALPVQGELSVALAQALYAMPMAPSEKPDEMAIRLSLSEATADERVWQQVDPQAVLPREPASLLVDLTGTARVTERIDRLRPGAPPPFEVSLVNFREVSASALGATATASGEVEILQPIGTPLGEVQVGLTGIEALVRALGRAGVLSPETVAMAEAIMAVYLVPSSGDDAWTTEIGFTPEGTLVNGLPVR